MARARDSVVPLPAELHSRMARLAQQRGLSVADLVRRACECQYGTAATESRLQAVRELAALALPVGDVEQMVRESVPEPDPLPQ